MTDSHSDPDYQRAMNRSLSLDERRASYQRWAESHRPHIHPGRSWHTHAGGDRPHDHRTETR